MILYITSTFPALTVTFIYREVDSLRRRGVEIATVSMNRPEVAEISAEALPFRETTLYLDQVGLLSKLTAFALLAVRRPRAMFRCLGIVAAARPMKGPRDYARLLYHWIEACYLVRRYPALRHIHAHFVNGPTSLAMFLSELGGAPFSFTMHASMIWRDPIALANKLDRCAFSVSISEYNRDYVIGEYGEALREKIHIVRCGIDPAMIQTSGKPQGSGTLQILAVGQLNARKGFKTLLEACARLRARGVAFRCTIVGDGEERDALEALHAALELGGSVSLAGAKTQEALAEDFREADVFALPCVISADGWRDGIPVALMEAMAWRIPVITTNILGLPELVEDGESGLLVNPAAPDELADAIQRVGGDPALRERLIAGGIARVQDEFSIQVSAQRLAELFHE